MGLTYVGIALGILIAIATGPLFRRHYEHLVQAREHSGDESGGAEPEVRLLRQLFLNALPLARPVCCKSTRPTLSVWVETSWSPRDA